MFGALKDVDWKAFLKGPVFVILVAAGCFLAGRQTAPESVKIVTVDKVTEIHRETQQVSQKVDMEAILRQIKESAKTVDRQVIRETITQKDGTKIERETDTSKIAQTSKVDTNSETKTSELTEIKTLIESMKQKESTKLVEKLRAPDQWRVGAQVGVGMANLSYIPQLPGHMVLGVFADYNVALPLVGNVGVGVWLTSRLDGGLQLSKSF
jgi:hypothetical protein